MSCIDGDPLSEMERLMKWLPENIPPTPHPKGQEGPLYYNNHINIIIHLVIIHGDYRPENVIFHPTEVRKQSLHIKFNKLIAKSDSCIRLGA